MRTRALLVALVWVVGACRGGPSHPDPLPSPSPSPIPVPGGTLQGQYVLRIEPSATCGAPGTVFTFPVDAAPADTAQAPGFQVVIRDSGRVLSLEMELQYTATNVRGGLGTTEQGELSREGILVWVRAVGSGPVTTEGRGPGQVLQGTLMGYLAFGHDRDPEGTLGSCTSLGHRFSLRVS